MRARLVGAFRRHTREKVGNVRITLARAMYMKTAYLPLTILTFLPPGREEVESLALGTMESPSGALERLVDSFDTLLSIADDASWL